MADKYKIISNNYEALFQEEILILEKRFNEFEEKNENVDFKNLSLEFFIEKKLV